MPRFRVDRSQLCETSKVKPETRVRLRKAATSAWYEWSDAPWFVILIILVTAFVGATAIWALWQAITGWF